MAEDQLYIRIGIEELRHHGKDFENCRFKGCDFTGVDLSDIRFADCQFTDCTLALAGVNNTAWQNVQFNGCKLSGVHFSRSSNFLFEAHFTDCILDNAVFYQKKNKKAQFINCSLIETDFTEADLTGALFKECNLNHAFFERTILKTADFSTSYNYTIDPENNLLKKAKFSVHGLPGLLSKYDIVVQS